MKTRPRRCFIKPLRLIANFITVNLRFIRSILSMRSSNDSRTSPNFLMIKDAWLSVVSVILSETSLQFGAQSCFSWHISRGESTVEPVFNFRLLTACGVVIELIKVRKFNPSLWYLWSMNRKNHANQNLTATEKWIIIKSVTCTIIFTDTVKVLLSIIHIVHMMCLLWPTADHLVLPLSFLTPTLWSPRRPRNAASSVYDRFGPELNS